LRSFSTVAPREIPVGWVSIETFTTLGWRFERTLCISFVEGCTSLQHKRHAACVPISITDSFYLDSSIPGPGPYPAIAAKLRGCPRMALSNRVTRLLRSMSVMAFSLELREDLDRRTKGSPRSPELETKGDVTACPKLTRTRINHNLLVPPDRTLGENSLACASDGRFCKRISYK